MRRSHDDSFADDLYYLSLQWGCQMMCQFRLQTPQPLTFWISRPHQPPSHVTMPPEVSAAKWDLCSARQKFRHWWASLIGVSVSRPQGSEFDPRHVITPSARALDSRIYWLPPCHPSRKVIYSYHHPQFLHRRHFPPSVGATSSRPAQFSAPSWSVTSNASVDTFDVTRKAAEEKKDRGVAVRREKM